MDVAEFERLLHIGLGRAILFLQENDATPYREAILHACLHVVSLDRQCDAARASYMFDIIQLTNEVLFYREQIFAALPKTTDLFDAEQLFDLLRLFAEQGDEDARQLMYDQLATNVAERGDDAGAYAIVELDGLNGFLFIAEQLAKWSMESGETDYHTMLLEHVEYEFGEAETLAALEGAASDNEYVAYYTTAVREGRVRYKPRKRIEASNLTYEEILQQSYDIDFTTLRYQHLRQYIIEKGERVPRAYLIRWGEKASDEAIAQAGADLLKEDDPGRLLSYLRIFNHRQFPLDPTKLVDLVQTSDEEVAFWLLRALRHVTHPLVRELSLKLLKEERYRAGAVSLFQSNFTEGDFKLIADVIAAEQDENELYWLGYEVRPIVERYPAPDALDALLQLYDREPHSSGREKSVDLMMWLDVLPEWVREECRYDANLDIRALVAEE